MKRFIVTMTGLIIALLLLVIWNVTSGSVSVDGMQMWQVLLRQTREGTFYHIVWDIRMPRLLAALFLGGALAGIRLPAPDLFPKPYCRSLCAWYFFRSKNVGRRGNDPVFGKRHADILPWHGGGSPLSAPCLPWALSCSYPCAYRRCRFWSCVVL